MSAYLRAAAVHKLNEIRVLGDVFQGELALHRSEVYVYVSCQVYLAVLAPVILKANPRKELYRDFYTTMNRYAFMKYFSLFKIYPLVLSRLKILTSKKSSQTYNFDIHAQKFDTYRVRLATLIKKAKTYST